VVVLRCPYCCCGCCATMCTGDAVDANRAAAGADIATWGAGEMGQRVLWTLRLLMLILHTEAESTTADVDSNAAIKMILQHCRQCDRCQCRHRRCYPTGGRVSLEAEGGHLHADVYPAPILE
jgi:hypothetical protein